MTILEKHTNLSSATTRLNFLYNYGKNYSGKTEYWYITRHETHYSIHRSVTKPNRNNIVVLKIKKFEE